MKWMVKTVFLLLIGFLLFPNCSFSQKPSKELTPAEVEEYKEKVKQLVSFLEFALNTIGDPATTTREKETIINQSYLKAFRDNKVIIEDDLDDNRAMVTNKNVQAYLKDFDFFFKQVNIQFNIQNIEYLLNDQGKEYFKVTLNRLLNGITLGQDTVTSAKMRYIEVNLNEVQKDLKIASIYTTKISEKEELLSWWNNLSPEWKAVFKKEIGVLDSLDFRLIQQVAKLEKIDVSGNKRINDLEAISKLSELKELNVSNTSINNLLPLRNLTKLRTLDASNTKIDDLEALKYTITLKELYCNNTQVSDVSHLENLQSLELLHCSTNPISNVEPVKHLQSIVSIDLSETYINNLDALDSMFNIKFLNIAKTPVTSLEPLKGLNGLERLDFAGSQVRSVEPLKELPNLKVVIFNNTPINSLEPLNNTPSLERIYCDNTLVTRNQANYFMAVNPDVLVIFKSDQLKNWWAGLNEAWKKVFIKQVGISPDPNKEELARIAKVNSIDINGNLEIKSLQPLSILENLKSVSFANTGIGDLTPLRELDKLEQINCSFNPVQELGALSFLRNLKILNIEKTEIIDLSPLSYHGDLEMMYCDDTPLEKQQILDFSEKYPQMLIVHKTDSLIGWWNNLDEEWIKIFNKHLKALNLTVSVENHFVAQTNLNDGIPSREDLHRIANLQIISVQNNSKINNLSPLSQLINLRNLQVVNTFVTDLSPLASLKKLKSLDISFNPIVNLSPIKELSNLVYLNIANTPVSSLDEISGLREIEEIDCSGTQIKNLNALSEMHQLKLINFSNTSVRSLSPIEYHENLVQMSCYNTRISYRKVEKFKEDHPNVDVRFY